jgi:hypothetical protein
MQTVDIHRGIPVVAKRSLLLIAPVLLIACQTVAANACHVVGYKNGEPLCATTSDGPGQPYTDGRARLRLQAHGRFAMNRPFVRIWAQRPGESLRHRNTFVRYWPHHEPLMHRNSDHRGWNW